MQNSILWNIFLARVEGVIAEAAALRHIKHNLVKGRIREIVLEELINPVIPPSFSIGSGIIVDQIGGQSGEIDIIITNKSVVPNISFGLRDGIFPIEAVMYAIEVKSRLESKHADEIIKKFRDVHKLESTYAGRINTDSIKLYEQLQQKPNVVPKDKSFWKFAKRQIKPATAVFAYEITGRPEYFLDKFGEANSGSSAPPVQILCVVGKGYWRWIDQNGWKLVEPTAQWQEIISLLAGISNTMFDNQTSLFGANFGNYLEEKLD